MGEVVSLKRLLELRGGWKRRRIVFTNGVFDLIHYGHLKLLEDCRKLGSILIVGLNSDKSVRQIKGKNRPIIPFRDRSKLLAALAPVDYVVGFDDPTPRMLIIKIRPDVLVKGADYDVKQIVGAREVQEWGGKVVRVKILAGRSTSDIIKKILMVSIK